MSCFFLGTKGILLHQREDLAAFLEEVEAADVLECPPGTSEIGLSALPAPLREEPQAQGLIAVAEQTLMKSKCKRAEGPKLIPAWMEQKCGGQQRGQTSPRPSEVVESEESQPLWWLTERAHARTKGKCGHSLWQIPTKVWVVAESVL